MKRLIDLAIAATALVVLLPALLSVAIAVGIDLGSPILFRQGRVGRSGKRFQLLKFRTMRQPLLSPSGGISDDERCTALGRWLRSMSLDELPSLWNVLNGEMSVVGPRPLLPEYLPLYSPRQARRHEIRPGITGWAQVNGRNAVDWATRLEMDVWYVENRSFLLDLKILGMTAIKVLRREGINQPGNATMEPFTGQGANG